MLLLDASESIGWMFFNLFITLPFGIMIIGIVVKKFIKD